MSNIGGISGPGGKPPSKETVDTNEILTSYHDLLSRLTEALSTQQLLSIDQEIQKIKDQIKDIPGWFVDKARIEKMGEQLSTLTQMSLDLHKLYIGRPEGYEYQAAEIQNRRTELLLEIMQDALLKKEGVDSLEKTPQINDQMMNLLTKMSTTILQAGITSRDNLIKALMSDMIEFNQLTTNLQASTPTYLYLYDLTHEHLPEYIERCGELFEQTQKGIPLEPEQLAEFETLKHRTLARMVMGYIELLK